MNCFHEMLCSPGKQSTHSYPLKYFMENIRIPPFSTKINLTCFIVNKPTEILSHKGRKNADWTLLPKLSQKGKWKGQSCQKQVKHRSTSRTVGDQNISCNRKTDCLGPQKVMLEWKNLKINDCMKCVSVVETGREWPKMRREWDAGSGETVIWRLTSWRNKTGDILLLVKSILTESASMFSL